MNASLVQKGLVVVVVLVAALSVAVGVFIFTEAYDLDVGGDIGRFVAGTILVLAGPMTLAGLWWGVRQSQSRGCTLMVIGVVPVALCCWWTIFIRDCPDQTDSSNHVTLWDGSNYKRAA